MTTALSRVARCLAAKGARCEPPVPPTTLRAIEKKLGHPLLPELLELYAVAGPGSVHIFSPVTHHGVVNGWPLWPLEVSLQRMQASGDPLWQLTPALDVWFDTHEVTILHEDDVEQSFPTFASYWEQRLSQLERSSYDPMTRLWLPPELLPQRVDAPAELIDFVLSELRAKRPVLLPGIGRFDPQPPATSTSSFNFNHPSPGPSLKPHGLDRCEDVDLTDLGDLPTRWNRPADWILSTILDLHKTIDEALENGPVDLMGMFRMHAKHHEARVFPSPDEPVEVPAYRQVTARVAFDLAEELAPPTP